MSYINFGEKTVDIENSEEVIASYDSGFVATRKGIGRFEKIRSLRINLNKFELSSENRRILRKFPHELRLTSLPYENYQWQIHKIGKDFYDLKFGTDTFSANKIKEIFTEKDKNNFSLVAEFSFASGISPVEIADGYCICLESKSSSSKILHYSYPFYKTELINSSFGIYMMTKAISECKELGYDYIYLGSVHSSQSKYKLQFEGLEWFDEKANVWTENLDELKSRLD